MTLMLARANGARTPRGGARGCAQARMPARLPTMPAADVGSERRARLAAARLYLVCDANPGGRALPDVLRAAIAGGVDVVQLRDKQLGDEELVGRRQRRARAVRARSARC